VACLGLQLSTFGMTGVIHSSMLGVEMNLSRLLNRLFSRLVFGRHTAVPVPGWKEEETTGRRGRMGWDTLVTGSHCRH